MVGYAHPQKFIPQKIYPRNIAATKVFAFTVGLYTTFATNLMWKECKNVLKEVLKQKTG